LGLRVAVDILKLGSGHTNVAWALRVNGDEGAARETLWLLYSLAVRDVLPFPIKYRDDATHEVTIYALSAAVGIRFERPLWKQSLLVPRQPSFLAFQFPADGDDDALVQMQVAMARVMAGQMNPDSIADWLRQFPRAVDIYAEPVEDKKRDKRKNKR